MKRVLITGLHSYVGNFVAARMAEEPEKYRVDKISLRDDVWKSVDFSIYDCVFHVAGVAHVSTAPDMESLYMRVNRDLAIEVGEKAKRDGVRQLIFTSSSIVYGDSVPDKDALAIDYNTPLAPANFYGESKVQAEGGLRALENEGFSVAVLRCPMMYGPGCARGNFPTLARAARKLPVFPDLPNRRSVLYVGNLAELVCGLVDRGMGGTFLPQNSEYMGTSQVVALMAEAAGRRILLTRVFNAPLRLMMRRVEMARKAFGSLFYDQACSDVGFEYRRYTLRDSIREIAESDGWSK